MFPIPPFVLWIETYHLVSLLFYVAIFRAIRLSLGGLGNGATVPQRRRCSTRNVVKKSFCLVFFSFPSAVSRDDGQVVDTMRGSYCCRAPISEITELHVFAIRKRMKMCDDLFTIPPALPSPVSLCLLARRKRDCMVPSANA